MPKFIEAGWRQLLFTMPSQPTSAEIHAAILSAYQQWLARFREGDAASVAALYAAEGQLLPVYSPAIRGRATIQAFWQGCIDMGIYAMERTPREVDCLTDTINEATVNEVGDYCFLDHHNRVLDVGKYVVIWKWRQGRWQIQRDIWTSNLPSGA